jgi:hypothetical protein
VDQDNERPLPERCELHDHAVVSLCVLLDEQTERESVWSIDLEELTRALDILTVPLAHDPESPADPRVDLRVARGSDPVCR